MNSDNMKNESSAQSPMLYRALKALAGAMILVASLAISYACISALLGDQEMLIEFIDEDDASLVMTLPTILAIVVTNILGLVSLGLLLFSSNRFLNHAQRGELLVDNARNALMRLGVAMILLYLTTRLVVVVIPLLGVPGFWEEYGILLLLAFVDLDFLYLLIGFILIVCGRALREGQAAKEEAKQYV